MKINLVNQFKELEEEKDKLRALQIDASNQAIDSYLMKDSLINLNNKKDELSSERRKSADEVSIRLILFQLDHY